MQDKINADLKSAMLAKDVQRVNVLKSLKTALTYAASGPDKQLDEAEIQNVLAREAKKRAEAAEIYQTVGEAERASAELAEKAIIDSYLPEQISEDQITEAVKGEIAKLAAPAPSDLGKIIGAVRAQLGAGADGATIARIVKANL